MDNNNTNKDLLNSDNAIEVKSLEDFYSWIKSKNDYIERINSRMPLGNKFKLFFRGENKINEEILPSIYRNGRIINEHRIFNETLNQSPISFKDCKTTFDSNNAALWYSNQIIRHYRKSFCSFVFFVRQFKRQC